MVGCTILVYALWSDADHPMLLTWYGAMLVTATVRLVTLQYWRITPVAPDGLRRRRFQFHLLIFIFAFVTASSIVLISTLHRPESPYFIILMITGLSAGVVVMYSADLIVVFLFLMTAMIPVIITCLIVTIGDSTYVSAGLILFFLGFGLLFTSKKANKDLINALTIAHERQMLLQALSEAKAQSDHASQAKSRFLATMTHELRTPLNAIMGFSEIIMTEAFGPVGIPRYQVYAQDIHASAEHLLTLINDVLDAAKIEAGGYALCEDDMALTDGIERVLRLMRGHADQKNIAITLDLAAKPILSADERAIRQILLNLLSNAVKFSKPHGAIHLATRFDTVGNLVITVKDQGIGIPAYDVPHVQTAFHQASNARSTGEAGTGLGLAITRSLVQLHGGTIALSSEIGRGTTVEIMIPAARIIDAIPPDHPRAINAAT